MTATIIACAVLVLGCLSFALYFAALSNAAKNALVLEQAYRATAERERDETRAALATVRSDLEHAIDWSKRAELRERALNERLRTYEPAAKRLEDVT